MWVVSVDYVNSMYPKKIWDWTARASIRIILDVQQASGFSDAFSCAFYSPAFGTRTSTTCRQTIPQLVYITNFVRFLAFFGV
jgi:hypothetical protein